MKLPKGAISSQVSVVMPTYNGQSRGFLCAAIESVLSQTFTDLELLVIDDGSTDGTKKLCEQYKEDVRFKYFYQKNSGVAAARNIGIKNSLGKYICFYITHS